jgi:hypothetical protein
MSESETVRLLRAENAALERAVNSEEVRKMARDYARMKILVGDVYVQMIASGWHQEFDSLLLSMREEGFR